MELTRRTFLHGAGAGLALAVTGAARTGWTATTLNLGSAELTTLSDGYLVQPRNFVLGGMPEAEYMPILRRHGLSPEEFRPECNVTLFRDGDRVVLFDAGSGSGFLPTVGTLPEAMDAIGLNPEDVTHVVFTHGHADHLWGVLDDFDEPFFPNAKHMMGRVEFDYWFDPDTVNRIAPTRTNMAVGGQAAAGLAGRPDHAVRRWRRDPAQRRRPHDSRPHAGPHEFRNPRRVRIGHDPGRRGDQSPHQLRTPRNGFGGGSGPADGGQIPAFCFWTRSPTRKWA
ncbi:MBL fold metallo-hydrolase [Jhaorihella thermophila]